MIYELSSGAYFLRGCVVIAAVNDLGVDKVTKICLQKHIWLTLPLIVISRVVVVLQENS